MTKKELVRKVIKGTCHPLSSAASPKPRFNNRKRFPKPRDIAIAHRANGSHRSR